MRMLVLLVLCSLTVAGQPLRKRPAAEAYAVPDLKVLMPAGAADLRSLVERYQLDREVLARFYDVEISPAREASLRQFFEAWNTALDRVAFDSLDTHGRVDYVLLRKELRRQLRQLTLMRKRQQEITELVPFAGELLALKETRQRVDPVDPAKLAAALNAIHKQIEALSKRIRAEGAQAFAIKKTAAARAVSTIDLLQRVLRDWNAFYSGYDPAFTWWMKDPAAKLDKQLSEYAKLVRERVVGLKPDDRDTIIGDPVGREALLEDLEEEMIPYSPDQLVAIANREFAWCEQEMLKASRELGFGEDWKKALEHVKNLHVAPGAQPALVLDLAIEAIEYLEKHQLITVPSQARDYWRMRMMSPERQRLNPFFLGGESIIVSYPTDSMTHEEKMMSMRGNNPHFSRSTVFHELVPGHHLQFYMNARNRPYRRVFSTPFWTEGWAFYWEMLLWDKGFPRGPEDRIGMLFWRMHRCARIIFSLSFHLEKMTAQECVKFLIDRVGHEPENAAAEVRRSFEGDYPPLYQSAYMLGA
ncbi:MAG: DUF885 family protein, partial [Bryobacterales bacterium]|nr:DUF885 family protein [Bryobacterales bacterium]